MHVFHLVPECGGQQAPLAEGEVRRPGPEGVVVETLVGPEVPDLDGPVGGGRGEVVAAVVHADGPHGLPVDQDLGSRLLGVREGILHTIFHKNYKRSRPLYWASTW